MSPPTVADLILGSASLRRWQAVSRGLARSLARVEVSGMENVPARGPVVVAMNHRAFFDGPFVFGFVPRPITCLVKVEAFTPGAAYILRSTGQIPVRRDRVDLGAVRLCLRILRGGGVVGIFPEGSRGNGLVERARPGVAYLAMRTGAPVVPLALHGTDTLRHGTRRTDVRLVAGPPIRLPAVDPKARLNRRVVAEQAERVRVALAALVAGSAPDDDRTVAA